MKGGASRVIGWPENSYYIGSGKEMEEWTSVPIGWKWKRMKLLGSHTTTKRPNRRQEHEIWLVLKRDGFAGLGKRQGKRVSGQGTNV
jgi:hypothetical protein